MANTINVVNQEGFGTAMKLKALKTILKRFPKHADVKIMNEVDFTIRAQQNELNQWTIIFEPVNSEKFVDKPSVINYNDNVR